MASNELRRLRSIHNELKKLYDGYSGASATHRAAIAQLGPIHSGSSITALQRSHAEAESKLTALRQEVDAAIAAIQKRATRQRTPATEQTKNDIKWMLERGGDVSQICEWILSQVRADGFPALKEVIAMHAYTSEEVLTDLYSLPTSERTPERWIALQEQVILNYERQIMEPAQLQALDELREVEASRAYLFRNFENLTVYLTDQGSANGGHRSLTSLHKWPGLPGSVGEDDRPLLADGASVQLVNSH